MGLAVIVDKLDDVDEKFHELYTERDGKFTLTGIDGMKTQGDIDRLTTSLNKERDEHKLTKEKATVWGDLDYEETVGKLDRIKELETAAEGKLDEEKINELVEGRISSKLSPVQRELEKAQKERDELAQKNATLEEKDRIRRIHNAVRAAAVESGVRDTAVLDATDLSERCFEINEEGNVVVRDNIGYTPGVDAVTWLTEVQDKRPHWWGESSGGGGKGSKNKNLGNNPFTAEHWNLTEQGRLVTADRAKAENMAKSAGTTIGGAKPATKA